LKRDFPEVVETVRLWNKTVGVERQDRMLQARLTLVDKHVFDVFDLVFVKGDPQTAFQDPSGMLITESTALRLFGEEDPMGKILTVNQAAFGGDYVISGILKDYSVHSTIRFNLMITKVPKMGESRWHRWLPDWSFRSVHTYVLLSKGSDFRAIEQKLPDFIARYMGVQAQAKNMYHLQPLHRVYLYSRADYGLNGFGDAGQLYVLCVVAAFILVIACVNFMNLATAQSVRRAREVGLRKVVGASRWQLIQQFLGESLIVVFLALLLAIGVSQAMLPVFNDLIQQTLVLDAEAYVSLLPALVGTMVFTGVLAGSYPAFALSAWQPIETLKHQIQSGSGGAWLWKGLVMFQFSISIFLIIGTLVVRDQISFMLNRDLGFETEQLVMLPIFSPSRGSNADIEKRLSSRYRAVKQSFLSHPNVLHASAFRYQPFRDGGGGQFWMVRPEGLPDEGWRMMVNEVDEGFLTTLDIELVRGKSFTPGKDRLDGNFTSEFLINESTVKAFGWNDPIGNQLEWVGHGSGTVVGVFKDYNFDSLKEKIKPLVLVKQTRQYTSLALKVRGEQFDETMTFLEAQWEKYVPIAPFDFRFMDEILESAYRNELRLRKIVGISSLLAILVCCLGLFGLAALSAQRRTKEIGVRKVLGASVGQIVTMFSTEFIKLVAFASLIAWPLAYYMLNDWLADFSYRIGLGISVFVLSSLLAIVIALMTVSYQAWKAAQTNPIEALKYE
jgi:putative ABC transport system permease protein